MNRTTNDWLDWIFGELMEMRIMKAMEMLHDPTRVYSEREQKYLAEMANIPFEEEDGNDLPRER